jgi:hypothetical protein
MQPTDGKAGKTESPHSIALRSIIVPVLDWVALMASEKSYSVPNIDLAQNSIPQN